MAIELATRGHITALGSIGGHSGSPSTREVTMPATITRRLVPIGEAAEALAVSTRTARRYISDGQLEAVRALSR